MESKGKNILRTGSGDKGLTSLYSGERVHKNHPRTEAVGHYDELVAVLGLARHHATEEITRELCLDLQRKMFVLNAEIATVGADKLARLPEHIDAKMVSDLDETVQSLYQKITLPKGFILPGETLCASYLHLARSVARRCERAVVALYNEDLLESEWILAWTNRLSMCFYLLALLEEKTPRLVKS